MSSLAVPARPSAVRAAFRRGPQRRRARSGAARPLPRDGGVDPSSLGELLDESIVLDPRRRVRPGRRLVRARACLRLVLAAAWTAVVAPVPLVVLVASFGNRRAVAFTGPLAIRVWSAGLCRILGIRVARHGDPPARGVATFVTPNHLGYVDLLVLGSIYGGHFVSRADVATWPVIGPLARCVGTLFIRREVRRDVGVVGGEIGIHLGMRRPVTAFLEGRSGRGDDVMPFRTSLLEPAVAAGLPCIPVAVEYDMPGDPHLDSGEVVAWTGDQPFGSHVWRLLHVRRVDVVVRFLPARRGTCRKELGRLLEDDVRAALLGSGPAVAMLVPVA